MLPRIPAYSPSLRPLYDSVVDSLKSPENISRSLCRVHLEVTDTCWVTRIFGLSFMVRLSLSLDPLPLPVLPQQNATMAHTVFWPGKMFFYPIGNMSPVSLLQHVPPEDDADILLLGCGDPRNILYSLYASGEDVKSGALQTSRRRTWKAHANPSRKAQVGLHVLRFRASRHCR